MAGYWGRALLGGVSIGVLALASPAAAQTGDAARDARIQALQAQLDQIQKELTELKGGSNGGSAQPAIAGVSTPPPPPRPSPTSGASAGLGEPLQFAQRPASAKPASPVPTTAASARIDAGKPVIATQDGRFTANLAAVMQFDVADYFQRSAGPLATDLRRGGSAAETAHARSLADGSTFRRARIGINGKAFGDFDYNVLLDFGGSGLEDAGHVQELWLQYSGWQPAHIRVGAFPPFIGLEDAGSTNGMLFLERPAPADIARSLAGGDFREAGQIAFTGGRWFASAAVTGRLVNTQGASATQAYRNQLGLIGRVALLPVKDDRSIVHLGLHGSYVAHAADTGGPDATGTTARYTIQMRERPELRVDGTRLIDTGGLDADHAYSAGAEIALQHDNFFLQGEYERLGVSRRLPTLSDPHFHGFYVEGSWILTGQKRRYNDGNFAFDGPRVDKPFDPLKGQWGVWELAARYSDMNLNYRQGAAGTAPTADAVRGGEQHIVTAGLNWYLNQIARIMLDYQHVKIERLSPNATSFQTPVGAEIGQAYSTGEMRFQLAF
jgi:phosphate-selective porin OprO and OprP